MKKDSEKFSREAAQSIPGVTDWGSLDETAKKQQKHRKSSDESVESHGRYKESPNKCCSPLQWWFVKYVMYKLWAQLQVVTPIAVYMMVFQVTALRRPIEGTLTIILGLVAVVIGLAIFLEGLEVGLMPIGEKVGTLLPQRKPMSVTFIICFILGIGVTFAEPSIEALQTLGQNLEPEIQPYLYFILNEPFEILLVFFIGLGVGVGCVLGVHRMSTGKKLKAQIYTALIPTLVISSYMTWGNDKLDGVVDLCWDCGAITTGPVTVPIVLALGIGLASNSNRESTGLSGFGVVTLASLYPIIAVEILMIVVSFVVSEEYILGNIAPDEEHEDTSWIEETPWDEILASLQSVGPLVVFMLIILFCILKEKLPRASLEDRIDSFFSEELDQLEADHIADMGTDVSGDGQTPLIGPPKVSDLESSPGNPYLSPPGHQYMSPGSGYDARKTTRTTRTSSRPSDDLHMIRSKSLSVLRQGSSIGAGRPQHFGSAIGSPPPAISRSKSLTRSFKSPHKTNTEMLRDVHARSRKASGRYYQKISADLTVVSEAMSMANHEEAELERKEAGWSQTFTIAGLIMVFVGMLTFTLGLRFGLGEIGEQTGEATPALFRDLTSSGYGGSPYYEEGSGLAFAVAFIFLLGVGATVAEPALSVLGQTVEDLTNKKFKKVLLIGVVALGVGIGVALAILKVTFKFPLMYLLIPAYMVALVLTYFSDDDFVGVAWDSAGVTTGPITVPLILNLGVAFGQVLETTGFGILALASVGPIISVLFCGIIVNRDPRKKKDAKMTFTESEQAHSLSTYVTPPGGAQDTIYSQTSSHARVKLGAEPLVEEGENDSLSEARLK